MRADGVAVQQCESRWGTSGAVLVDEAVLADGVAVQQCVEVE